MRRVGDAAWPLRCASSAARRRSVRIWRATTSRVGVGSASAADIVAAPPHTLALRLPCHASFVARRARARRRRGVALFSPAPSPSARPPPAPAGSAVTRTCSASECTARRSFARVSKYAPASAAAPSLAGTTRWSCRPALWSRNAMLRSPFSRTSAALIPIGTRVSSKTEARSRQRRAGKRPSPGIFPVLAVASAAPFFITRFA